MTSAQAGYSDTPLARKLGLREGDCLLLLSAPREYQSFFGDWPEGVRVIDGDWRTEEAGPVDLVHLFSADQSALAAQLQALRHDLDAHTPVWVSWPKKASKVPSTVSEDSIRAAALPLGFVDIKVCAVSAVWSGLKLVVRKTLR